MNVQMHEEFAAANAQADRFDGFDRGDLGFDYDAARDAENAALLAEMIAAGEIV